MKTTKILVYITLASLIMNIMTSKYSYNKSIIEVKHKKKQSQDSFQSPQEIRCILFNNNI
jgi:hypothetical protein